MSMFATPAAVAETDTAADSADGKTEPGADDGEDKDGLSRRKEAEVAGTIKEFSTRLETAERGLTASSAAIAARDAEIMRLRGVTEAIMNRPPPPAPREETPEEIIRTARAKMAADNDMEGYERALLHAADVRADAKIRDAMTAMQRSAPQPGPQIPQELADVLPSYQQKHPALMATPNWRQMVQGADLMLSATMPDGPERWGKAFANAEAQLPTAKPRPTFPRGNAAVLSTDGAHAPGDAGDGQQALTDQQKKVLAKSGMTEKEYRAYSKPGSELTGVKW